MENHLQPVADCAHLSVVMRNLWYLCVGAGKYHCAFWGKSKSGWNKYMVFTICIGKPAGSRFGQMVSKIQDW